jgi:hypothetical protein
LELAANHYGCDALFILAGTRKQVDEVLQSKSFSTKNSRMEPTQVLHLHGSGKLSVKIRSLESGFSESLHTVLRKYSSVRWPSELNCGEGTQIPKEVLDDSYTAVVWHIKPVTKAKRRPFSVASAAVTKDRRKTLVAKLKKQAAAKKSFAKKVTKTAGAPPAPAKAVKPKNATPTK